MLANATTQMVSIVIVIAIVHNNDIISNESLTFGPFIIMDSIYVVKPNNTKGEYCHCHHN